MTATDNSEVRETSVQREPITALSFDHLPPWQQQFVRAFITALSNRPIVSEAIDDACAKAGGGISRMTAYKWREKDEAFRQAWDDALERGWDRAEAAAYTRGVEGIEEPVFNKSGEEIGSRRVYSDRLLELLLKGNRAKTYRETHKVEVEHGLSKGMEEVLRDVRMRRQEAKDAQCIDVVAQVSASSLLGAEGA